MIRRGRWVITGTLIATLGLSAMGAGRAVAASDPHRDGLSSAFERTRSHTDPAVADSDGNGTPDGREDPDGDGLDNRWEQRLGLDPLDRDTDGDGRSDGSEDPDGDRLGNQFEDQVVPDRFTDQRLGCRRHLHGEPLRVLVLKTPPAYGRGSPRARPASTNVRVLTGSWAAGVRPRISAVVLRVPLRSVRGTRPPARRPPGRARHRYARYPARMWSVG